VFKDNILPRDREILEESMRHVLGLLEQIHALDMLQFGREKGGENLEEGAAVSGQYDFCCLQVDGLLIWSQSNAY
jgi:hypothetical protein